MVCNYYSGSVLVAVSVYMCVLLARTIGLFVLSRIPHVVYSCEMNAFALDSDEKSDSSVLRGWRRRKLVSMTSFALWFYSVAILQVISDTQMKRCCYNFTLIIQRNKSQIAYKAAIDLITQKPNITTNKHLI